MAAKTTGGSHNGHAATCETLEPTRTLKSEETSSSHKRGEDVQKFDSPPVAMEIEEPEDLETDQPDPPAMVVPVVVPPTSRQTENEDESISPERKLLLDHLLRMAELYSRSGSVRQAIELFFTLVVEHGDTDQGTQASHRLMAVAEQYESHGELRQARGIYERLLKAS